MRAQCIAVRVHRCELSAQALSIVVELELDVLVRYAKKFCDCVVAFPTCGVIASEI